MQKKYILIFVITLFFGCSKQDEDSNSKTTPKYDGTFAVTLDEAKLVAQNAHLSNIVNSNANKRVLKRNVVNGVTIRNKDKSAAFHVFTYEGGGFTIISGDKRTMPIMAYSDNSNYSFNEKDKPGGLIFWERATKERIQMVQTLTSEAEPSVLKEWNKLSCPVDPTTPQERKNIYCGGGSGNTTTVHTTGPLLNTEWDQGCTFNNALPSSNRISYCFHMPTGCVATSIGQVMRYWHYPNTYNWGTMPQNWGNTETQRLMKDVGVAVSMHYEEGGSWAYAKDIPGVFNTTYGYAQADYIANFNDRYSTIVDNIRISRPVILGGCDGELGCHSWVCDGYQTITSAGFSYLNLHMNWGWGPQSGNGWFTFDNWPVTVNGKTYNFQYHQDMVINIHPPQN